MSFWETYFFGLFIIMAMMTVIWIFSGVIKNAGIVDSFWGVGFVLVTFLYFSQSTGLPERKMLIMSLVLIWAIRLSLYITWRNWGKGEDPRYQQFREDYGLRGYWWYSFRQVFLLQGLILWVVSSPLLAAQYFGRGLPLGWIDLGGSTLWLAGFIFETMGDYQLYKFRSDPANKGKVLDTGLWKYTRHPNYFGDALIWWGFGLFAVAAGNIVTLVGPLLMTILLVKISGVSLLERTLMKSKSGYADYVQKTSSFIPWFPRKRETFRK